MKIPILLVLSCFVLSLDVIEGLPFFHGPPKPFTQRERSILREVLCRIKKLSSEDCVGDDDVQEIISILDPVNRSRGRTRMNLPKTQENLSLPPSSSKREAFYSDWRRK